jgi:hypothetical protein
MKYDENITIGSSPVNEPCVQTDKNDLDYPYKQKIECLHYIEALRKKFGDEPEGARLKVDTSPHEFGAYREVICQFNSDIPEAIEYAFRCESESPLTWAEVGMEPPKFD